MMRQLPAVTQSDTVDIADVASTLKRQWRAVVSFVALGVLSAIAVILWAPRRYDGKATVLARAASAGGASVLGRMTGIGDLMGGLGGLGGVSPLETELQMLRSRLLAGLVVDSLDLQFMVKDSKHTPANAVIAGSALAKSFAPRKYRFELQSNGSYRISGDSIASSATPGQPIQADIGSFTLQRTGLPREFQLIVMDREDAITAVTKKLEATKAGGEIAKISYRANDPVTAAAAPNALVHFYLERRRTVDRGANERRVEYVSAQMDSTAAALAAAERDWRKYQEATRVYDADISDKSQVESAAKIREVLVQAQADESSIKQLLEQADKGILTPRDLAAYPALAAAGPLVAKLTDLEVQRTRLLERRTERDPEVIALDQSMKGVSASIATMAQGYASAVTKRRVELESQLDSLNREILALPAAGEKVGRLKRDVIRLTEIYTALQAQLVEARLGAIGEGGEVRQIDVAAVPRKPAFPQPILTMGIGLGGGLFLGVIAALFMGLFGRSFRDPIEVERALGIAAERFRPDAPLLVAGAGAPRTVLVVPLDERAPAGLIAARLARTATARALPATLLDLSANRAGANGNGAGQLVTIENDSGRRIDQLEQQDGLLVVQLPPLSSDATLAALKATRPVLLVAPPGPVDRARLATAVETLRRLEVPCAGVIMGEQRSRVRSTV